MRHRRSIMFAGLTVLFLIFITAANKVVFSFRDSIINHNYILGIFDIKFFSVAIFMIIMSVCFFFFFFEKIGYFESSMIVAGSLSNLIERLEVSGVRDYFNLLNITYFNLADVLIVFGFVILVYKFCFTKIPSKILKGR